MPLWHGKIVAPGAVLEPRSQVCHEDAYAIDLRPMKGAKVKWECEPVCQLFTMHPWSLDLIPRF